MPPPMTKCSICGQNVMKAQTYHVGNGQRACKTHEGVNQKKDELAQKTVEDQAWKQKIKDQDKERKEARTSLGNKCWACERAALTEQEFYLRLAIAKERLKLKGIQINPLTPEYAKEIRDELDSPSLGNYDKNKKILVTTIYPTKGNEKLVTKLPPEAQQCAELSHVVSLCQDCANNVGFQKEMPDITMKDLLNYSIVFDMIAGTTIKQIAKDQINGEVIKN